MAVVLEALLPDTDNDVLASIAPHEIASWHREPWVVRGRERGLRSFGFLSSSAFKKFFGARIRRSASSAISSARLRARSERPPSALAWTRQAIRRKRNCL